MDTGVWCHSCVTPRIDWFHTMIRVLATDWTNTVTENLKVYIGYDPAEDIAWEVANHSLKCHASKPVDVFPLK